VTCGGPFGSFGTSGRMGRLGTITVKEIAVTTPINQTSALGDMLALAWLTQGIRAYTRATLAGLGEMRVVPADEVLMREGEPSDFLGVVLSGRVALRLRVPERGPVTILTVEPGDVVGWSALVPPYRATSTAITLTETELALFDGNTLRAALADDDGLAAELYPVVLNAVARRLEGTRLQLLDLFSQRWVEPW
jgi:CRP/FNR family transcriptional regulator, cyclic AMP receptor protein